MFRKTPCDNWSNKETSNTATFWHSDFKEILWSRKQSFKSVKDITEAFREHVYSHAEEMLQKDEDFLLNLEDVNWAEIATTFVVNNPIWIDNYTNSLPD